MKTGLLSTPDPQHDAAPIVQLADESGRQDDRDAELAQLARARAFAEPLLDGQALDTGEDALVHADGVAAILQGIGAAPSMRAAAYLVYASDYLSKPEEVVSKAFGASYASLVLHTRKLVQIQRAAREARVHAEQRAEQTERVRKMLLAFSRDLRVVLLRLASRLQTLRHFALSKQPCPAVLARESLQVFAPLANRLGIWQIKWEMEDLSFRFLEPLQYKTVARLLDEKRVEREQGVEAFRCRLGDALAAAGLRAEVQGRPKHLYSIWKKMRGKGLDIDRVFDVRAMRVIVADVPDCYAVLSRVHELWPPVPGEFDDYIARPKVNGYQSLHTVVQDEQGRAVEVQIRTRAMHEHAEHGVAAHWAYKEAGTKGYAGVSASGDFDAQVAEARKAVLRQLLAWEREFVESGDEGGVEQRSERAAPGAVFDDRIYVFTPDAAVIELPAGATPIDFAYTVHTDLGHRCRGAKVDGTMVPLNTPLQSGQTVEVTAIKEGGPSLDWLNDNLGYLQSSRSKAKVRAWFNALALRDTVARGREAVEKLLQREGRTSMKLDDLAAQLGFRHAEALFEVVGKDEFSLRNIEALLRPPEPQPDPDAVITQRLTRPEGEAPKGGVLVVGVESLMTSLSRCCRPAPPDAIGGYVTRGRGVAIHRADCSNFRQMAARSPERVIPVAWGERRGDKPSLYPVDVLVEAADRQGLLRDISEVFAKEKMNVTGVNTQSVKDARGGTAWMTFTVEVADSARLNQVLAAVDRIGGVRSARRK
ncbi:bifunctional (p)ppGpp synthetase/guanosine-3',5'-bis(diphosphate) 3'-pyrophosphohydrolase [Rhizobacter sp. SG703]|uniref:RelA/SpoT family protein n=1 Tax=Rhizobacter sp. SG703 TaxID=2587140 RepID=UPI001447611E|nr:bifunctional (p)ppGpp synthetase/guanosine-3',5'-bis(diphosphate) 3'-pyrophosphohydrolase [Rhizobacter sp. SG703]NKI96171.1 GTP pyrophosphokinase [Rhizobacter sp. SG703]